MSQAFLRTGQTEKIIVYATNGATKVTGVTWTLKIVRLDNGQFWNGSAWQSGVTTVNMSQADSVNRPGEYYYDFAPVGRGYICSIIAETSNAAVAQKIHTGTLHVGYGLVRDAEVAKKYIANKLQTGSGIYTVYEDDGSTPFEAGTFDTDNRTPP